MAHWRNGTMTSMMVVMDRAGRIVIPKELRDRLALRPDSEMEIDIEGQSIRLTPGRGPLRSLEVVDGWPVFQAVPGQTLYDADVQRLRDADQR
jgi:AbrB family looped-hinge helix DNA binding protein